MCWSTKHLSEKKKSVNKAFQEVLKFAEQATHEHTRGFSNRCSQCVQIRDANDPTQTTTKEPELQKIRSESRHEGRLLTLPHRRSNDHECGDPKAAGYAVLNVCLSVYYRLETESMAAIHRDAILHIDGETPTRALSIASQHVKCKEMSSSVDLGVPQQ